MAKIIVLNGDRGGETIRLWRGQFTIGRLPDSDIMLPDANVSRHHSRLTVSEQGCFIEDLGSRHGTLLEANPVDSCVAVKPGSTITLGKTIVWVCEDNYHPSEDDIRYAAHKGRRMLRKYLEAKARLEAFESHQKRQREQTRERRLRSSRARVAWQLKLLKVAAAACAVYASVWLGFFAQGFMGKPIAAMAVVGFVVLMKRSKTRHCGRRRTTPVADADTFGETQISLDFRELA